MTEHISFIYKSSDPIGIEDFPLPQTDGKNDIVWELWEFLVNHCNGP